MQESLNLHLYRRESLSPSSHDINISNSRSGDLLNEKEQEIIFSVLVSACTHTRAEQNFILSLRFGKPISYIRKDLCFNVPAYFSADKKQLYIVAWFFDLPPTEQFNVLVGLLHQRQEKIDPSID